MQEWISVKKTPNDGDYIIVVDPECEGKLDGDVWIAFAKYEGNGIFRDLNGEMLHPLYWMEIPMPPKK